MWLHSTTFRWLFISSCYITPLWHVNSHFSFLYCGFLHCGISALLHSALWLSALWLFCTVSTRRVSQRSDAALFVKTPTFDVTPTRLVWACVRWPPQVLRVEPPPFCFVRPARLPGAVARSLPLGEHAPPSLCVAHGILHNTWANDILDWIRINHNILSNVFSNIPNCKNAYTRRRMR